MLNRILVHDTGYEWHGHVNYFSNYFSMIDLVLQPMRRFFFSIFQVFDGQDDN